MSATVRDDDRVAPTPPRPGDPRAARARALLAEILRPLAPRTFAVALWDGSEVPGGPADPALTIRFAHPAGLRRLLLGRDLVHLGEGYLAGEIDLDGDVEQALAVAPRLATLRVPAPLRVRAGWFGLRLPRPARADAGGAGSAASLRGRRHSRERDAAAVRHHYDVGNAFYALWLDRRMVYSCAYFERPDVTLDEAQERKLERACRKLALAPGLRLLDVGCGWGGLVRYAAERHGAIAHGITLSVEQCAHAQAMLARTDVAARTSVDLQDYRDLPDGPAFDRAVSIGMCEHVGRETLDEYFRAVLRCLRPGGLFLNHGIARRADRAPDGETRFVDRFVFPDGDLPPIGTVVTAAERAGFEVLDLEALRPHYATTLRRWVRRLESRRDEAVRAAGERAYRLWRLYMAGCARTFDSGAIGVFQLLLAKPRPDGTHDAPLVRRAP